MTACRQQRSCSKQSSRGKKGSEGSSTRAAWRLQCPSYVNPFTLNAQLKGWLEAGKAEVALKGLWHKAKPRGAYGPKGAGRWPHHLEETALSATRMVAKSRPLSITSCICASSQFVLAHFRVLHTLASVFCTVCTVCACMLASVFCTC